MSERDRASRGYVLLEDGTRFEGDLCGAATEATGEVVFNTSITGYQEAVTDPSYAGQIITFTYPMVGNYGVGAAGDGVRPRPGAGGDHARGANGEDAADAEGGWLDWLADCGVPAITGVDTRTLVRHIRDQGAMRGGIFAAETPEAEARERIAAEPLDGRRRPRPHGEPGRADRARRRRPARRRPRHRDQALDHSSVPRAELPR